MKAKDVLFLLLLTAGAFLIQGYHPNVDDAEFYVPAVKKLLNPSLYPYGAEFFETHAKLTLFPHLVAWTVRASRLPLDVVLLSLQLACIFLFLLACWKLSCTCFEAAEARWCAVASVAATLAVPVAGTALFLLDTFPNPRSVAAFAVVFAIACAAERRHLCAGLWLAGAALMHPLMAAYGAGFVLMLAWTRSRERVRAAVAVAAAAAWPQGIFDPPSPAYHHAALQHNFHYVVKWPWFEWIGIFAPLAIFLLLARIARTRRMESVELLCRTLVPFVLISLAGALILDIPQRFEALARFQPLRSLHLTYVFLFLLMGGMLGQFVLKRSVARWLLLFIPVCAGMYWLQLRPYPVSAHIEWPGAASRNPWVQAFEWIRRDTPQDAYFALDPLHMEVREEEVQGFRAIAERSMLADMVKDSGAVSMFPGLAEEWWEKVSAIEKWKTFQAADFRQLKGRYGVGWVVVEQPGVGGLDCPYQNPAVQVCRVN